MIHLVSCNQCNLKYVGETTLPLDKRINLHRRVRSGWKYFMKVFKDVYVSASFLVQMIKIFPGTGYRRNKACLVNREIRLDREDCWKETLWTSYHCALNESKRSKRRAEPSWSVGCLFQSQEENLSEVGKTSQALNPYLHVFITILQMILKMNFIIYESFWTKLGRDILKGISSEI